MWASLAAQRRRKLSDWPPLAVIRLPFSAARRALLIAPCSADELVPGKREGEKKES